MYGTPELLLRLHRIVHLILKDFGKKKGTIECFGMIFKCFKIKMWVMEMNKVSNGEKRRRKVISRPVLVRSVKAGQASSATYSKESSSSLSSIWKS